MSRGAPPLTKPLLLLFILVSLHVFSGAATARSLKTSTSFAFPHTEVKVVERIGVDALLLDYEPPGANPAHEPPKKGAPRASNNTP